MPPLENQNEQLGLFGAHVNPNFTNTISIRFGNIYDKSINKDNNNLLCKIRFINSNMYKINL